MSFTSLGTKSGKSTIPPKLSSALEGEGTTVFVLCNKELKASIRDDATQEFADHGGPDVSVVNLLFTRADECHVAHVSPEDVILVGRMRMAVVMFETRGDPRDPWEGAYAVPFNEDDMVWQSGRRVALAKFFANTALATALSPLDVYDRFLQAISLDERIAEPPTDADLMARLLLHHNELLAGDHLVLPAPDQCLVLLARLWHKAPKDRAPLRLTLLAMFGQVLRVHAESPGADQGQGAESTAIQLADLEPMWTMFDEADVAEMMTWHDDPGGDTGNCEGLLGVQMVVKDLVAEAAGRLYELERSALVPGFRFVTLVPLLCAAGVLQGASAVALQEGVAGPPGPLPDFRGVKTGQIGQAAAVGAPSGLERSETLMQRDAKWEQAVKLADKVVERHTLARTVLQQETAWVELTSREIHAALCRRQGHGDADAEEHLRKARHTALKSLQLLETAVQRANENSLFRKVGELAGQGVALRRRTYELVQRFGSAIGSSENDRESIMVTLCGFTSEAVTKDGDAREAKINGPAAMQLMPWRAASSSSSSSSSSSPAGQEGAAAWGGDVIFVEPRANAVRLMEPGGAVTTVMGRAGPGLRNGWEQTGQLKSPSGLAVLRDGQAVLVADTGNHVLRLLLPPGTEHLGGWYLSEPLGKVQIHNVSSVAVCGQFLVAASRERGCIYVYGNLMQVVEQEFERREAAAKVQRAAEQTQGKGKAPAEPAPGKGKAPAEPAPGGRHKPAADEKNLELLYVVRESSCGEARDGDIRQAMLRSPGHLVGMDHVCFFLDRHAVRVLDLVAQTVTTVVGEVNKPSSIRQEVGLLDGPASKVLLNTPEGLAVLSNGHLLISDTYMGRLCQLKPKPAASTLAARYAKGTVHTVVGGYSKRGWHDGPVSQAKISLPGPVVELQDGTVLMGEPTRMRSLLTAKMQLNAQQRYKKLQGEVEEATRCLLRSAEGCGLHLMDLVSAVEEARNVMLTQRHLAVNSLYARRIPATIALTAAATTTADPGQRARAQMQLEALITVAPGLVAMCEVLRELPESLKHEVHGPVGRRLQSLEWHKVPKEELEPGLAQLAVFIKGGVLGAAQVRAMLTNESFLMPLGPALLALVEAALPQEDLEPASAAQADPQQGCAEAVGVPWRLAAQEERKAWKSAVVAWLLRIVTPASFQGKPTFHRLLSWVLHEWVRFWGQHLPGRQPEIPAGLLQVARWLISASLEMICHGSKAAHRERFLEALVSGLLAPAGEEGEEISLPKPVMEAIDHIAHRACEVMGGEDSLRVLLQAKVVTRERRGGDERSGKDDKGEDRGRKGARAKKEEEEEDQRRTDQESKLLYGLVMFSLGRPGAGDPEEASLKILAGKGWLRFLEWFHGAVKSGALIQAGHSAEWRALQDAVNWAEVVLHQLLDDLEAGAATYSMVQEVITVKVPFHNAFRRLGVEERAIAVMGALVTEVQQIAKQLKCLKEVAVALLEDSEDAARVARVAGSVERVPLTELRRMLRSAWPAEGSENTPEVRGDGADAGAPALPVELLSSCAYLHALLPSELFQEIWEQQEGPRAMSRVRPMLQAWGQLHAAILDKTIRVSRLQKVAPLLVDREQRALFCWLAPHAAAQWEAVAANAADATWRASPLANLPVQTAQAGDRKIQEAVTRFLRLQRIQTHRPALEQALEYLQLLLAPAAVTEVGRVRDGLTALSQRITELGDWATMDLARLEQVDLDMDTRLFNLDPELLAAVLRERSFLEWLAEQNVESDFQSSVEMAMGRPEMECPPELWWPRPPDEARLSMLTTLRKALHSYLYEHFSGFKTLGLALDCLDGASGSGVGSSMAGTLEECASLHKAFVELLGDETDSAPNRLLNLANPKWQSGWAVRAAEADGVSGAPSVWLEYSVVRRGSDGGQVAKRAQQTLSELQDFQSAIVLARGCSTEVSLAVTRYVEQLGWLQELAQVCGALQAAGHFRFERCSLSFAFTEPSESIRAELEAARATWRQWEADVLAVRTAQPVLNLFTMKQLGALVHDLDAGGLAPRDGSSVRRAQAVRWEEVYQAMGMRSTDADLAAAAAALRSRVSAKWADAVGGTELVRSCSGVDAKAALLRLGDALQEAAPGWAVPQRERWVRRGAQEAKTAVGAARAAEVQLIAVGGREGRARGVLATFIGMTGRLPEWPQLTWCSARSTVEEVLNLLLRWALTPTEPLAGAERGSPQVYCLAGADLLPAELQYQVVSTVMRLQPTAQNTLLLVVSPEEASSAEAYVTRQLAHCRRHASSVSDAEMAAAGESLSKQHSRGMTVHHSRHPGAGKSFDIRLVAASMPGGGATLVHFPIHRHATRAALAAALLPACDHSLGTAAPAVLLHLDLAETVSADLEGVLLEVLLLGCLYEPEAGVRHFMQPGRLAVAVELATPGLLDAFPLLQSLPQRDTRVSAERFAPSAAGLAAGMGPCFAAARHDGTCFNSAVSGQPAADAWHRLQFVAAAMRVRAQEFAFPAKFSPPASAEEEVPGADCYTMLLEAGGGRHSEGGRGVSLWSLWAFLDVLYWQLRGLNDDASPIRRPINLSDQRGDQAAKDMLRAEVLAFLCRTAADFTMRAGHTPQTRSHWLHLQEWNLSPIIGGPDTPGSLRMYLARTAFESSGKPVYRHGTMFDPTYVFFRADLQCWVMDSEVRQSARQSDLQWVSSDHNLTGGWQPVIAEGGGVSVLRARLLSLEEGWAQVPYEVLKKEADAEPMALGPEAPGAGGEGELLGDLLAWGDTNHECLMMDAATQAVCLLARDAKELRKRMHPGLLAALEACDVVIEDPFRRHTPHHTVLSALTNVHRTQEQARKLLGGHFALTGDVLLKILAVFVRARCGVPVLLMGECGCGKTHMLKYMCAWIRADLLVLDVHGGTTEQDILDIFSRADAMCKAGPRVGAAQSKVYVFLDEVNTCAHMGLISEVMCGRTLHGRSINPHIQLLAACNPYRRRKALAASPGLTLAEHRPEAAAAPEMDPLAELVYRVHPVPARLKDFVFDFGALEADTELRYIESMVRAELGSATASSGALCPDAAAQGTVALMMAAAQKYVRAAEGDASAVSLRDIKRTLQLMRWFSKFGSDKKSTHRHAAAIPAVLGIAHVFYFRLAAGKQRDELLGALRGTVGQRDRDRRAGFDFLIAEKTMEWLLSQTMQRLCGKLQVEEGVAMNQALVENLYVTLVCIFNRIPVFIVGRPGSSKTLTLQILGANLRGAQSPEVFWRKFPALYLFQYQCSPLSTAQGIQQQFNITCSYQQKAAGTIATLLLDEVGLAEHSPDMPLKVLHSILVKPKVAIVGLSNWTLDAAKMNRAVLLQRPDPSQADIHLTGAHILQPSSKAAAAGGAKDGGGEDGPDGWLDALSWAFHAVYCQQGGRDFLGMRDYYHAVKLVRRQVAAKRRELYAHFDVELDSNAVGEACATANASRVQESLTPAAEALSMALCRNFGGKPALRQQLLSEFHAACARQAKTPKQPPEGWEELVENVPHTMRLLRGNLEDADSRHLMLLTRDGAALSLLQHRGILPEPSRSTVLIGSSFPEDAHELYLIQQVNLVKAAMAAGRTVVLLNQDPIYEALYEVLNQRYVTRQHAATGTTTRMLRLAVGARSQLCPVAQGFKLVVVVEQQQAYEQLDLPLLNRFEKQVLTHAEVLSPRETRLAEELREWAHHVAEEGGLVTPQATFAGYHEGTEASLVASAHLDVGEGEAGSEEGGLPMLARTTSSLLAPLKRRLADLALPLPAMRSATLASAFADSADGDYFDVRRDPGTAVAHLLWPGGGLPRPGIPGVVGDGDASASPNAKERGQLAVVLTSSPLAHLEPEALRRTPALSGLRLTGVQLAEVASERQLHALCANFFSGGSGAAGLQEGGAITHPAPDQGSEGGQLRLLVVQCDPLLSTPAHIRHAQHICGEARAAWATQEAATGCGAERSAAERHIIFVVHLPPGARECTRQFNVELSSGWRVIFVDDMGTQADVYSSGLWESCTLSNLLHHSLHQLLGGELEGGCGNALLHRLVAASVSPAVALCAVPDVEERPEMHNLGWRAAGIQALLLEEPRFAAVLHQHVLQLLAHHRLVGRSGLHQHVELATGAMAVGSMKVSLALVVQDLMLQAVVLALSALDVNHNLALLFTNIASGNSSAGASQAACIVELWFLEAESAVLEANGRAAAAAALDGRPQLVAVRNTGVAAPMAARVPFSHLVWERAERVREGLMEQLHAAGGAWDQARVEATTEVIFGTPLAAAWSKFAETSQGDHTAYLADYAEGGGVPQVAGLPTTALLRLYEVVAFAADPGALRSPLALHVAVWSNELRLLHMALLLAAEMSTSTVAGPTAVPQGTPPWEVLLSAAAEGAAKSRERGAGNSMEERMSSMDVAFLRAVVRGAWQRVRTLRQGSLGPEHRQEAPAALWERWARGIPALGHAADALLNLLRQTAPEEAGELQDQFDALRAAAALVEGMAAQPGSLGRLPGYLVSLEQGAVRGTLQVTSPLALFRAVLGEDEPQAGPDGDQPSPDCAHTFLAWLLSRAALRGSAPTPAAAAELAAVICGTLPRDWPSGTPSLAVRRRLLTAARLWGAEALDRAATGTPGWLELRLEYEEDVLQSEEVSGSVRVSGGDTELLQGLEDSGPGNASSVDIIQAVMRVKQVVRDYSALLTSEAHARSMPDAPGGSEGKGEDTEESAAGAAENSEAAEADTVSGVWQQLQKAAEGDKKKQKAAAAASARAAAEVKALLHKVPAAASYCLKAVRQKVGMDSLVDVLMYGEIDEWLTYDRPAIVRYFVGAGSDAASTAVFPLLVSNRGAYEELVSAMKSTFNAAGSGERGKRSALVLASLQKMCDEPAHSTQESDVQVMALLAVRLHLDAMSRAESAGAQPMPSRAQAQLMDEWMAAVLSPNGTRSAAQRSLLQLLQESGLGPRTCDRRPEQLFGAFVKEFKKIHRQRRMETAHHVGRHRRAHCDNYEGLGHEVEGYVTLAFSVVVQIGAVASQTRGSFLDTMVSDPGRVRGILLPSGRWNTAEELVRTLRLEMSHLTWYKCPKGHMYAVGECGGPMQLGRCPECKTVIGGVDHESAAGNSRVSHDVTASSLMRRAMTQGIKDMEHERGYRNLEGYEVTRSQQRMPVATVALLRLVMHAALLASASQGNHVAVVQLSSVLTLPYLVSQVASDLLMLRNSLRQQLKPQADFEAAVHLMIGQLRVTLQTPACPKTFTNAKDCVRFEELFEQNVVRPLQDEAAIANARQALGNTERYNLFRTAVGVTTWQALHELDPGSAPPAAAGRKAGAIRLTAAAPAALGRLFRLRAPVSFDHFRCDFESRTQHMHEFPLLAALLQHEARLPLIKHLCAILEWHATLFAVLGEGAAVTRVQAAAMSGRDVLARIAEGAKRRRAAAALDRFCTAFNEGLPHVPLLHQCQANPFLDARGRVDLTGSGAHAGGEEGDEGVRMTPTAPLSFSLPSQLAGEAEAAGLCTLRLAALFHRTHNDVVEQLRAVLPTEDVAEERPPPVLSFATPPELVQQMVIMYDRQRDLLPLLYEFKQQGQGPMEGISLTYDYA
ncbi:hypothetical protein CYMTET_34083, partial [Cymbomonas tetramitiformis]